MRGRQLRAAVTTLALVAPVVAAGAFPAAAAPGITAGTAARQAAVSAQATVAGAVSTVTEVTQRARTHPRRHGRNTEQAPARARGGKRADAAEQRVRALAAANPHINETCGLDATLTLDSSGSIGSSSSQVKQAAQDFLIALKDTNSTLRINSFADRAKNLAVRSPVNAQTTGPGGVLANGVAAYPKPNGGTNWMEGLDLTNSGDSLQPELLIFVTDGDPTRWTNSDGSLGGTGQVAQPNINNSLARAIPAADRVKGKNTRVLVVGVGTGLNNASSQGRMKDISGPNLYTTPGALVGKSINDVDAVAFTDFAALGAFLRSVVTSLCGNSVTIQKLAQSGTSAQYLPAAGWNMTVTPTVAGGIDWIVPDKTPAASKTVTTSGAQGAAAFQWKPKQPSNTATVNVSEQVNSGFHANRWECDVKTPSGSTSTVGGNLTDANPAFNFTMASSDVAACRLYNDFEYRPAIAITKTAADDPVRGNAAGWDEAYTYRVTNTGNTAMSVSKPVDTKCTGMSGPTGPGAPNQLLPGDSWTYTCTTHIEVPTTAQNVSRTNHVVVVGNPVGGGVVTAEADATVAVKTPAVTIEKSAKDGNGNPIPDGGSVPAGTRVTYSYLVTNTGNDVLKNVDVSDDTCSPLTRTVGTGSTLPVGGSWTYTCSKKLQPPSTESSVTNIATVTADWSNPQNRPQNNGKVTDTDSMKILVDKSADLQIVKVTNPGATDRDFDFTLSGQGVPSGDQSFTLNAKDEPHRNVTLNAPSSPSSVYTITENGTGQSAWPLTNLVCDAPTVIDLAARTAQVTIEPKAFVTCTFTNQKLPTLSVTKQTSPAGSSKDFGFTATRPVPLPALDPQSFTLEDEGTQEWDNIPIGAVTITEDSLPAGWRIDGINCGSHPAIIDVDAGTATVTLTYADDVNCVYSNAEIPPATLTVLKTGTSGVSSPAFPFTASGVGLITPGDPGSDSFSLAIGEDKEYSVHPAEGGNTYTVTESAPPPPPSGESGWALTSIECVRQSDPDNPIIGDVGTGVVNIPLTPGDNAVCTYVNQQRPRVTIDKKVVVAQGQSGQDKQFTFDTSGSPFENTFTLGNDESNVTTDIVAGDPFTVTEQAEADWDLTGLACHGPGSENVSTDLSQLRVQGMLDYGDDVFCQYINTKEPNKPATLTVVKQVDPTIDAPRFDYTFTSEPVDPAAQDFSLDPRPSGTASKTFTLNPYEATLGGTDYTIEEQSRPGWDNTQLECRTNGSSSGSVTGAKVVLNLDPGDDATCTYTNQPKAQITIIKQVSVHQGQTGGDKEFDFTTTGLGGVDPTLGDNEDHTFADIDNATDVSITETNPNPDPDPDTWSTEITCRGTGVGHYSIVGRTISGQTQSGDDVTCAFVNTKKPDEGAILTVTKVVDPAAPAPSFDYTFSSSTPDPAVQDFSLVPGTQGTDSRTFSLAPFSAGLGGTDYSLDEQVTGGWDFTDLSCTVNGASAGTGTPPQVILHLVPGDVANCTYTNTKQAQLTIAKQVSVSTGQSGADRKFDFTTTNLTPGAFQLGNNEEQAFADLTAGTDVTVDEPGVTGWQTTVSCSGVGSGHYSIAGGQLSGTTESGDDVTCTYVNTKDPLQPALLTVVKQTDPNSSPATFDFTASGTGLKVVDQFDSEDFTLGNRATKRFTVHPVELGNDYTVVEHDKTGWDRTEILCMVASDPTNPISGSLVDGSVTVPLLPGDSGVCIYDNTQRGSLTIEKVTDTATARSFAFSATNVTPTTFSLGDGATQVFESLTAGTVATVIEHVPTAAPDRWDLLDIACSGASTAPVVDIPSGEVQVTIGAGEDVQCHFIDSKVEDATIEVIKAADPADGTEFPFVMHPTDPEEPDQDFLLRPDGDVDDRTLTVHPAVSGSEYTITEDVTDPALSAWNLDSIDCVSGGDPVGTVDLGAGRVTLTGVLPADTITCTYANRKNATLTVLKSAPDGPGIDFPQQWSLTPSDFALQDNGSLTRDDLAPGAQWVAENVDSPDFPKDWYLTGDHPTCVGSSAPVDYTRPFGADVDISAGEDVVCTFVNQYDYRPEIQLHKSVSPMTMLPGADAVYTYVVVNVGNVSLPGGHDGVVVDDKCAPVEFVSATGDPDTLDPNQSWTYTCRASGITSDTVNTGTATMDNPVIPEEPLVSHDKAEVDVLTPGIELDKIVDKSVVYSGTEVTYTFELRNTGETAFRGPDNRDDWITDDKCSPVTYVSGDDGDDKILEVDEVWTFTCRATITQDTHNTATLVDSVVPFLGDETGAHIPAQDTADVDVIRRDITLKKQATASGGVMKDGVLRVPAGNPVTYTYDVTSGNADTPMQVIDVSDDHCSPVVYGSGDSNGNKMVDPGETWHYTCTVTFNGAKSVKNTAAVVAVEPIVGGVSVATDQATVQTYVAGISIVKSPSHDLVPTGTPVTYSYRVTNTGTSTLSNVIVTDDKCSPLRFVSGDDNGDQQLQTTETWKYECVMTITATVVNVAVAKGTDPGGAEVTATSSALVSKVDVAQAAKIKVTKEPSKAKVKKGSKVTYTYKVRNEGKLALANVKELISDDKCEPVKYVEGDVDGNNLLTSGKEEGAEYPPETWIFTCKTKLKKTTTNTVTAEGTPVLDGEVVGANVKSTAKAKVKVKSSGGGGGGGGGGKKHHGGNNGGGGSSGQNGTPGENPSMTGADVMRSLAIALALIIAGLTFHRYARRRRGL